MNLSALHLTVVFLVPVSLVGLVWWHCRPHIALRTVVLGFFLGAISVWPVIRLGNNLAGRFTGLAGHYYFDELFEMLLATALPEELGKGFVALLVLRLAGMPGSSPAWIASAAAAHAGFAASEGILGALSNEDVLKVLVGRSLGALTHCSWGIIMAWFLWRGWTRRGPRWLNWPAGFLLPSLLHAIVNASLVEPTGAANPSPDAPPPLAAVVIMLSGLAALIASAAFAVRSLIQANRVGHPLSASSPQALEKQGMLI